jgi:branched-subunit amino acid ABC-type transport system permease component
LLALVVYAVVDRTRVGALVRATVADRDMVAAIGVDNRVVKVAVFAVGSLLATTAGVLGGPIYGARPGLDATVLILALVVVVIGGLGSVRGALVGSLLIGQVESVGRALLPDLASFVLFGALALVLVVRPQGLFGARA